MKEASLYEKLDSLKVHCFLCAHHCRIEEGKFGFCGVRQNIKGALFSHSYGKLVAINIDPVEKKPLYHFLPGTQSFSIASAGCNFRCGFCQNWQISQRNFFEGYPGENFKPETVVELAVKYNCKSISYTYTEPTIFFEFALETAILAKKEGLSNIFVSNGYMTKEAISLLKGNLDAANIDLKFFKESSYQRICSAKLAPVLESIRLLHEIGVWIEITTLIIPGENDTPEELSAIAEFIACVDKDIPWHVSAFHADYKFKSYPSTPEKTLKLAYDLGKQKGLNFIYAGNIQGWGQDTACSKCGKVLIKRKGFGIEEFHISTDSKCLSCKTILPGHFRY